MVYLEVISWEQVQDSGPIYRETVMGRLPVEPFNTFSNLVFLAVIIYFAIRVYRSSRQHLFITGILPVIFVGWIGGTVYHATRSGELWLLMDWIPIVVLCIACSFYFLLKSMRSWRWRLAVIALVMVLNILPRVIVLPAGYSNSVGYLCTALGVVIPIVLYLSRTRWLRVHYFVYAVLWFLLAVSFRTIDKKFDLDFLWMGTHWLWHLLGGVAVFWVLLFIYKDNDGIQGFKK